MDSIKKKLEALGYATRYIDEQLAVGFVDTRGANAGSIFYTLGIRKDSGHFIVRVVSMNYREEERFSSESQLIAFIKKEEPL